MIDWKTFALLILTCSVIVAGCFALGQYYLVALYTIGG